MLWHLPDVPCVRKLKLIPPPFDEVADECELLLSVVLVSVLLTQTLLALCPCVAKALLV